MKYGKREYLGASLELCVATALPMHMRRGIIQLTKLRTDPQFRRQGYAHMLMMLVCAEADVAGKMLLLKVGDGEIGGASKQQLLLFYQRFGFVPVQAEPMLMARSPIAARVPGIAA